MSTVHDPYTLQRFVDAQNAIYEDVCRELRNGRKSTHWMWFIFPQLKGLGRTATADHFGIASIDEARTYLDHPVLGPRLRECTQLLLACPGPQPIERILGSTDAMKLRSSMTLFLCASTEETDFQAVLDRYYGGEPDRRTLELLKPA